MSKQILVTGGCGYIGSHTCLQLLEQNYEVVVVDNLSNSKSKSLERVKQITGKDLKFYQGDILDYNFLDKIFSVTKCGMMSNSARNKSEILF